MADFKISLITVVYNAEKTIARCLDSVITQKFNKIQHIVIDGGSTDGTIQVIKKYRDNISLFISEPDHGIYDAMNKGIKLADGDIIGTLNADDYLADDYILLDIAYSFAQENVDILYGDLDFVDPSGKIVRKWRSGPYKSGMFNWGWMPPHPTFYCKKELFKKLGGYKLDYGSAADYELMLRFIHDYKANVVYLDKVLIKMFIGGVSNKNLNNRIQAMLFDLKAMRNNEIRFPLITMIFKPLRKIRQFF